MEDYNNYFLPTYRRKKLNVISHQGCKIITDDGIYLDMLAGLGVNALGGGNQKIKNAIIEQTEKYLHQSNFFLTEPVMQLGKFLVENSFADKVFLANSGTEAMEAALKLVKKYGNQSNKQEIIVFTDGFHGRTIGSLSLTAQEKYQNQVKPLLPNIKVLPFNDILALEQAINQNTAAVVMEVVQGEGGINVASLEYMRKTRELTTKFNTIMLLDEIQSGIGRTGKFLAFEHYGITPDLVTIAKALGGGLPLGALLVNEKYSNIFQAGDHGTTFGGNPLSAAAGLALLKQIIEPSFLKSVEKKSLYLKSELEKLKKHYPLVIGEIKVLGLMIGVEILKDENTLVDKFQAKKIITNITHNNILRLLPPLIISNEEINCFIKAFKEIITDENS